jgi:uncharacterized DUF497 family protein
MFEHPRRQCEFGNPQAAKAPGRCPERLRVGSLLPRPRCRPPGSGLALALDALYDVPVADREYSWTDAGKTSAARHGVTESEVVEALYSPQRIENEIDTLLLAVAGLADTTRVIVVVCERLAKVSSYAIVAARPATPEEIKQWMEGTR